MRDPSRDKDRSSRLSADSLLAEVMIRIITDRELRERLATGSKARGSDFDEEVVIPRLLRELALAD
ncbi:MAG TPA: hypothetical protein VMO47_14310 [Rhodothermales bacterium]|nr:hypothetical protein [Rhodothermales bacterium]